MKELIICEIVTAGVLLLSSFGIALTGTTSDGSCIAVLLLAGFFSVIIAYSITKEFELAIPSVLTALIAVFAAFFFANFSGWHALITIIAMLALASWARKGKEIFLAPQIICISLVVEFIVIFTSALLMLMLIHAC